MVSRVAADYSDRVAFGSGSEGGLALLLAWPPAPSAAQGRANQAGGFEHVHALALDATLVTNNQREFARIAGLRLDNWGA